MTTTTLPQLDVAASIFPTAGKSVWHPAIQEWVLTDSDGIEYFGSTPGEYCRQFAEALHIIAQHVRRSLYGVEDLLDYRPEPASEVPARSSLSPLGGTRERQSFGWQPSANHVPRPWRRQHSSRYMGCRLRGRPL
jgi:hypothetical protein